MRRLRTHCARQWGREALKNDLHVVHVKVRRVVALWDFDDQRVHLLEGSHTEGDLQVLTASANVVIAKDDSVTGVQECSEYIGVVASAIKVE